MSIRTAESFEKFREGRECEECHRPYDEDHDRAMYAEVVKSIERHNAWHEAATPEELAEHERQEKWDRDMARALMEPMLRAFRHGEGPWTYTFDLGGDAP